jgi:hypothetical protein
MTLYAGDLVVVPENVADDTPPVYTIEVDTPSNLLVITDKCLRKLFHCQAGGILQRILECLNHLAD